MLPQGLGRDARSQKVIGTADATAETASAGTVAGPQIQVVLNWFEDLKQRMSRN